MMSDDDVMKMFIEMPIALMSGLADEVLLAAILSAMLVPDESDAVNVYAHWLECRRPPTDPGDNALKKWARASTGRQR
jgi:hypothetical protein